MTLERLDDEKVWIQFDHCLNPEHEPPKHIVLQPGTYIDTPAPDAFEAQPSRSRSLLANG